MTNRYIAIDNAGRHAEIYAETEAEVRLKLGPWLLANKKTEADIARITLARSPITNRPVLEEDSTQLRLRTEVEEIDNPRDPVEEEPVRTR
jgi:hypothetical protein